MVDSRFFETYGPFSLEQIAVICDARLVNAVDPSRMMKGVGTLDNAEADQVTFLSNPKYAASIGASKAGACLLQEHYENLAPSGMALLIARDSYLAFAKLAAAFHGSHPTIPAIAPSAVVHQTARIGKDCLIEAGAVIGEHVEIGNNCHIGANAVIRRGVIIGDGSMIAAHVTLSYTIIGKNAIIHSGVRIGQDGFGFAFDGKAHIKVPQLGRVMIGNDVEIGANSCIDRGSGGDTIIGDGSKIDNLVQIGHNAQLGRGCIVVSQVGISGSTIFGDFVIAGGQSGFSGHLSIGSGVQVAAKSGVIRDVAPKTIVGGYPAVPVREWHRQTAALKKLTKKGGQHD